MNDTSDAKPVSPRQRKRRVMTAALTMVGVLVLAVIVIAVNRIPIAEKLVRGQLAAVGLTSSGFTIKTLTPWQATITDFALDRTGALELGEATIAVDWPSWTAPEVSRIGLTGLRLRLRVIDGKFDYGPLAPLLEDEGLGAGERGPAQTRLPPIDLIDALVEIDGPGGLLVAAVPRIRFSPAGNGDNVLKFTNIDLIHPNGQATLSGDAAITADGQIDARLQVADAEGVWAGIEIGQVEGRVDVSGAMATLMNTNVRADFGFSDLTGPMAVRASGNVAASLTDGVGTLTLDLRDAGHAVKTRAMVSVDVSEPESPVMLSVNATAGDLSRLGLPVQVAGRGNAVLETQASWPNVLSNGAKAFQNLSLVVTGDGIRGPDLPGTWAIDTDLAVTIDDDEVGLRTSRQARIRGDVWKGQVEGLLTGGVFVDLQTQSVSRLDISDLTVKSVDVILPGDIALPMANVTFSSSGRVDDLAGRIAMSAQAHHQVARGNLLMNGRIRFKDRVLSYRGDDCSRVTVNYATAGDVDLRGPLTLCVGGDGTNDLLRVAISETAPPRIDLAALLRAETPVVTIKSKDGMTAVLRTATLSGSIKAKIASAGHPAVTFGVSGLDAAIPKFDMDVADMGVQLRALGGADPDWNYEYQLGEVTHVAFSPVSLDGSGRWKPSSISVEGTLRQKQSGLIASLSATHNSENGAGRARIDSLPLDLAGVKGGIHAVTPYLRPFVSALTGVVQVSAKSDWSASAMNPAQVTASLSNAGITPARSVLPKDFSGVVAGLAKLKVEATIPPGDPAAGRASMAVTGGNASWNKVRATGVSAAVSLDSLWPPVSPPSQELKVARIDWGLPITDSSVLFRLPESGGVQIERAQIKGIGGRIYVADLLIGKDELPERINVEIEDLRLADIAEVFNIVGLKADGRISGRLPVELQADGAVAIRDGILKAIKAGALSFKPPTRAQMAQGSTHMAMVLDILEDLKFDDLSVTVDGDARKNVNLTMRIKGRNPKVQGGRPVDLTINLSGNIGEAIEAELQNFDIQGLVKANQSGGK